MLRHTAWFLYLCTVFSQQAGLTSLFRAFFILDEQVACRRFGAPTKPNGDASVVVIAVITVMQFGLCGQVFRYSASRR